MIKHKIVKNGIHVEYRAFESQCSWTLDSGTSSSGTGSSTSTDIPVVGRIVSNENWIAYEISNPSSTAVITHSSYTITSSTSSGVILLENRNDKYPMLSPGAKLWMYSTLVSLSGDTPAKLSLQRYERSSTRPTNQSEWPVVTNAKLTAGKIQFSMTNNSSVLRLSSDTLYYYFCLDSSGTPIHAGQELTFLTLLPKGTTQITSIASLPVSQCNSVSVTLGPVFSS
jgi:hypothetical protein